MHRCKILGPWFKRFPRVSETRVRINLPLSLSPMRKRFSSHRGQIRDQNPSQVTGSTDSTDRRNQSGEIVATAAAVTKKPRFRFDPSEVGFEMIDAFAVSQGIPMDTVHCKAIFGKGFVDDVPVFLAKPQTYMNLSGESSGPLAAYYKLPLNRVVVFHDDMDLPCGVLRLHDKGGHASHNGLKSVIYHFRGNKEFPRLRIGIGRPPGQMDPKAFLLQKFNATARGRIDAALEEGVGALKQIVSKGLTETARSFNTVQKYKHIKLQTLPL